jgi:hypothetical protein
MNRVQKRSKSMSDEELAAYLGIVNDPRWPRAIAKLDPAKRASYEHMRQVEMELTLWQEGVAPKPEGVIICHPHTKWQR